MEKHEGEKWTDILETDREYIEWLTSMDGPNLPKPLYEYLMELLEL